jgi:hypothetical protein
LRAAGNLSHSAVLLLDRPSPARHWFDQLRGKLETNALDFRNELELRFGETHA